MTEFFLVLILGKLLPIFKELVTILNENSTRILQTPLNLTTIKALRYISTFLKPYRQYFIYGMVFIFLVGALSLSLPIITGHIVDVLVNKNKINSTFSIDKIVLILLVLVVLTNICKFFQRYFFNKMNELTIGFIRKELYHRYLKYPISFFDKERIGELLSRINTDISMVQYIFCEQIPAFIYQSTVMIVAIGIMFYIQIKLTLITLLTFPIAILLSIVIGKKVQNISKFIQDSFAKSFIYVEETLQKIRTVKIFGNERNEQIKHEELLDSIIKESIKKGIYTTSLDSLGAIITNIVLVLIFWYGTSLVTLGEITIGNLATFFLISFLLGEAVSKISSAYANLQNSISVVDRLKFLMNYELEDQTFLGKPDVRFTHSISFKNCSFSYLNSRNDLVLKSINIEIKKGMKIGIVGASGAGKSTLIQLLLRFYKPIEGDIFLDEIPISNYSLQSYRKVFGVVSQEIELFGGTIKDNICYSSENYTIEDVIDAAKKANAYEFIEKLPDRFNTMVGENAMMLSGGQRQRIAIARALLKNPKILLLDEATSSVDSGTEKLIKEALNRLMANRTSIIIAHRMDTIRDADRILVFEKGEIIESGTDEELLKLKNGIYRGLINKQQSIIN